MNVPVSAPYQLVVVELGSLLVPGEPPCGRAHGRRPHVHPDGHVAEEEPVADERLLGVPRRLVHDVEVGRVEAERGGRQAVSDEVDPEQLDGDERLGHAQGGSQEDADDLRGGKWHGRLEPAGKVT